jgi:hypothetical protein
MPVFATLRVSSEGKPMAEKTSYVQYRVQEGPPQEVGGWSLTPQARVFLINTPWGGVVWNRPTAVIARKGPLRQHHPIPDPTRAALIFFFLFGVIAALVRR